MAPMKVLDQNEAISRQDSGPRKRFVRQHAWKKRRRTWVMQINESKIDLPKKAHRAIVAKRSQMVRS